MAHYTFVNHDKRFIACVNPKCACTTVRDWFRHTLPEPFSDRPAELGVHMISAASIDDYPDYYKLFVVRDPLRRLVSFYCNWVIPETQLWCFADDEGRVRLEGRTFFEFLYILAVLSEQGRMFQHHLKAQTPPTRHVSFDRVIKVEHLGEGLTEVNALLGIEHGPKHLNAQNYDECEGRPVFNLSPRQLAGHRPPCHEQFYNDELRELARTIYAEDVAFYEAC